ncbi:MAG: ABC transporter permease [Acidimicrobiia bacterium]|nr:ABC transporter permease [Acidimicrobiia bacterium]
MGRFGFVARRLLQTIPMLFGIVLVVFLVLQITPGDPARQIAGLRASEADLEEVRQELGLNDPIIAQYGRYVGNVLQGDLGYSYKSRKPVADIIGDRISVTVWLLATGVLMTLLISVPLGVVAALRKDRIADHAIRGFGLLGLSMPAFWTGVILLLLVALPTGWFPAGGFGDTFGEKLRAIFLPALTLAIGSSPFIIRGLRAAMISVMESDYISTARSVGVSGGRLVRRFVLRNAAGPGVTLLAIEIGYLLFGAVVIETTFALPGVGQGLVIAAQGRDLPSVQGYTLLFALVVVAVYLLSDVVTAMLDPRVEIDT